MSPGTWCWQSKAFEQILREIRRGLRLFRQGTRPAGATDALHERKRLSGRAAIRGRSPCQPATRQCVDSHEGHRIVEIEGPRGGSMEPVPARIRIRRGTDEPRVRAIMRNHGPVMDRTRSLQLQRSGHRQHGDAGAIRERGAEGKVARAAAGRRDPFGIRDDRARRREQRRHQHPGVDPARGRPLCDQRAQMVDDGRVPIRVAGS